jgi:hypothetical protein
MRQKKTTGGLDNFKSITTARHSTIPDQDSSRQRPYLALDAQSTNRGANFLK